MEGFTFSGDTAQTIARGIDFRFQDIRSLFYNEFLLESGSNGKSKIKEKDQSSTSDVLHLNQNFRTHSGVLKLSQFIIDLLYHFFPFSVILVRDESAKKEIIEYIGKQALVLTIVECKGLEFQVRNCCMFVFTYILRPSDLAFLYSSSGLWRHCLSQDVLLYNYFGTSPLKNQWRLLYEYMVDHELLDPKEHKSFPSFSQTKHKILCSELKQLYVAVREVDESLAQTMQVASSDADWSSRGIKAAGLRASANRMWGSDSELARSSLLEAAEIYDTIGKAELAARCYIDLNEFKIAGMYHFPL
ncbi:hypothetical protein MKW94_028341 [Papaver nudicaule]|uniref:Uncharacterized protein n=1 Tax=Papaver nudicaule TaxID=74823 RepID=A0AA41S712_PAPNU|nr:hypothetical protein [Papaver nudicaule]